MDQTAYTCEEQPACSAMRQSNAEEISRYRRAAENGSAAARGLLRKLTGR